MSSRRKGKAVRVSRTYINEPTSCTHALKLLLKGCAVEAVNGNEKAAGTSGGEDAMKGSKNDRTIYQYTG